MNHNTKNTANTLHTNLQPNHQQQYHFCCILITAFLCLTAFTNFATAADYYVATDGNDSTGTGAIGSPWLTIAYGETQLSAGDTLLIRAGRYYEAVTLTKQGTSGNPITIKAYTGEKVILDGRKAVTGWTQCESDDSFLTVLGVVNPNYASIYKTTIHEDDLPADTDDFMIFEAGIHSRIARWPDAEIGYGKDVSLYLPVAPEAYGETDFLLDTTRLTQADDYWVGALIDIWSHGANNWVIRRTIADNSQSAHTIIFDTPLSAEITTGTLPDAYSIVNHPHVLDSAGEFAHTMEPDGEGYYTFYIWPKDTDNLVANLQIPTKSKGVYGYEKDYITLDGLTVVGYSLEGLHLRGENAGNTCIEPTIQNCTVEDTGGTGILINHSSTGTIDNCIVNRSGDRGAFINTGTNGLISNCTVTDSKSTNISFYLMSNGRILNNTLYGISGEHGNGVSVYIDCDRILVAYNYFYFGAHLALQDSSNVVVFANVIEDVIAIWHNSDPSPVGSLLFLNNVVIGADSGSLGINTNQPQPYPQYYLVNNIINSFASWEANEIVEVTYNFYTGLAWNQEARYDWSLGEGEIDGTSYSLDDIFTDSDNYDHTLAGGSPAIGTGKSITALLDTLGITGGTPWFPGFDFTKDKAGNSWAGTPSMGAYEYTGPTLDPIGDQTVIEEDTLSFAISATDPDTDPITYGATGTAIDAGATLTGQNFSWTPNDTQSGTYQATFTATATGGVDSETITITVNNMDGERTLTINSTLGGYVNDPGDEDDFPYDHGTANVPIVAVASANYSFVNWTGTAVDAGKIADTNASSTTVTIMDADYTLFANFIIDTHTLTTSSSAGGSVITPGEGDFPYNYGTNVIIQASPQANYEFVSWTGTGAGNVTDVNAENTTVLMDAGYTLFANFIIDTHTLSISSTNYGSVTTPGEGDFPYDHGTTNIAIVATPSGSNSFENWTGTAVSAGKVASIEAPSTTVTTMDADYTLVANFAIEDTIAPVVTNRSPDPESIGEPAVNSMIVLDIVDTGSGVDPDTVDIEVNGNLVYFGDVYEDSRSSSDPGGGICRRAGSNAAYKYIFQPTEKFDFDEDVTVTVNASDRAGTPNAMAEYSYIFTTEVRSFGEKKTLRNLTGGRQIISSGSNKDSERPLTAVTDSSGNVWAAWTEGDKDVSDNLINRDVYLGMITPGIDSFESGGVFQVTNDVPDQANPVLAKDTSDNLYLVWQDQRSGKWDLYVMTSSDGTNWSDETRITDPNFNQTNPAMAINSSGKVYIVYEDDQNADLDIYIVSSSDSFSTQTTTRITSAINDETLPAIAVGYGDILNLSDDVVYVVWADARNGSGGDPKTDIYGAANDNSWTNIDIVTSNGRETGPKIAAESDGYNLHLIWEDDNIYYASSSNGLPPLGNPLTGVNLIDEVGTEQKQAALAVVGYEGGTDENELNIFVCWEDERNGAEEVYAVEATDVENVGIGTNILADGAGADQKVPAIGIDEHNEPFLVWVNNKVDIIYCGSTFDDPTPLVAPKTVNVVTGTTVGNPSSFSATFPAGAYDVDMDVSISLTRNPPKNPLSKHSMLYEFSPSLAPGEYFNKPVTITIPFSESALGNRPRPYWFIVDPLLVLANDGSPISTDGISAVTVGSGVVTFKTTHFTGFGLGGGNEDGDGSGSGSGSSGGGGGGGGGGCAMSSGSDGTIIEYLLPYLALLVVMTIVKLNDRRKKHLHE